MIVKAKICHDDFSRHARNEHTPKKNDTLDLIKTFRNVNGATSCGDTFDLAMLGAECGLVPRIFRPDSRHASIEFVASPLCYPRGEVAQPDGRPLPIAQWQHE